ncbi:MAG: hypothetical protein ACRD0W_02950 [Acidimicrobiales bacterium]
MGQQLHDRGAVGDPDPPQPRRRRGHGGVRQAFDRHRIPAAVAEDGLHLVGRHGGAVRHLHGQE